MLGHVGDILAPGGLKLAPRCLKIALCWLKLAPRRPKWPLKASQAPQDEAKMAPGWPPNRCIQCFSMYLSFSGALKASIFVILCHKFRSFFVIFGTMLGPDPGPQPPLSQPKPFETFSCGLLERPHQNIGIGRDW